MGPCATLLTLRIHGTGIFSYIYHKNQPNVGTYNYQTWTLWDTQVLIASGWIETHHKPLKIRDFTCLIWSPLVLWQKKACCFRLLLHHQPPGAQLANFGLPMCTWSLLVLQKRPPFEERTSSFCKGSLKKQPRQRKKKGESHYQIETKIQRCQEIKQKTQNMLI